MKTDTSQIELFDALSRAIQHKHPLIFFFFCSDNITIDFVLLHIMLVPCNRINSNLFEDYVVRFMIICTGV